jgi:hypothetical protein
MRSLVVMAMFTSSLTYGAWNGYTETRDLELSTSGVDILEIDAGAGDAIKLIEKHLVLNLEKSHSKAVLDAYFEQSAWHYNDSAAVDLEVSVPRGLAIFVDDGSGSVRIADVRGAVHRDD